MDIAEQVVVMNEGRIEQTGTATEPHYEPGNDFVVGFVGEVNRAEPSTCGRKLTW